MEYNNKTGDMTKSQNVNTSFSDIKNSGVATQNVSKKDKKKVKILVNCIYDTLRVYGYDDKKVKTKLDDAAKEARIKINKEKTLRDKERLYDLFLRFVNEAGVGSWKDLYKYKTVAFFDSVMDQKPPPLPLGMEDTDLANPSLICYGRAKRFLKKLSLDRSQLESFAQSIAQSKKGAPPVSEDAVAEAEFKCFQHLTTPREDIPDFIINDGVFEHHINRNTVRYQLRRTVREVFMDKRPVWEDITRPFVPSTSSQYNFSRAMCGGVGAFKEFIPTQVEGLLSKKLGTVKLSLELTELYGRAGKVNQELIDLDLENVRVKETLGLLYNGKALLDTWRNEIYPEMIKIALDERPVTMVIGLPEPLKVRCITAGPPITYAVLKPFQKWLWNSLKNEHSFLLIGTPVDQAIVREALGKLGVDEVFISGDYKASTDNLHSWVSESLLEALNEIWVEQEVGKDPDEFSLNRESIVCLMKRALTGHVLMDPTMNDSYRKGNELRDTDFRDQKEGQLMGSIISFPFLCLANAALCRWAMEISEKKALRLVNKHIDGYKKCRLLINGDDCVFPGNSGLYDIWENITKFGGLESSIGKTFVSNKFLTINSVQFKYYTEQPYIGDDTISEPVFEVVPYVNLGLVYGQKKDGVRGKPFYRLGALHRDLFKTCPPEHFERAHKLFLENATTTRYKKIRERVDGKWITRKEEDFFSNIRNSEVPWYLPEWLGGLGFVKTRKDQINKFDLHVASFLRGSQGDFKIRKINEESSWQFHKLFSQEMEDFLFLDNQNFQEVETDHGKRSLESQYRELYTLTVVDCLLKFPLDRLIKNIDKQEEFLRSAWINNKKIWKTCTMSEALRQTVWATPIADYEDLLQEKKKFFLSCFNEAE